jgi:hypothetical protein
VGFIGVETNEKKKYTGIGRFHPFIDHEAPQGE